VLHVSRRWMGDVGACNPPVFWSGLEVCSRMSLCNAGDLCRALNLASFSMPGPFFGIFPGAGRCAAIAARPHFHLTRCCGLEMLPELLPALAQSTIY